jgi:hypothetical protein
MRAHGTGHRAGILILVLILLGLSIPVLAQDNQRVLQAFENQAEKKEQMDDVLTISTKEKHKILFFMGIALLIGVLVTAGLGIAMGVYGKPVFVAHMLFAGLSVTLALIHAIVAIVWFFPF